MNDDTGPAERAQQLGLALPDVKEGLRRLLPILKTVAKLTPNKFDDAAVTFLESLLSQS